MSRTRSHTWRSQWTDSARPMRSCTGCPTSSAPVAGHGWWRIRWSTWCREPGPTCSPRRPGAVDPETEVPVSWREHVMIRFGRRGPARKHRGIRRLVGGVRPRRLARPGRRGDPERRSSRGTASIWLVTSLPHQSHAHLRCGHAVLTDRVVERDGHGAEVGCDEHEGAKWGLGGRFSPSPSGVRDAGLQDDRLQAGPCRHAAGHPSAGPSGFPSRPFPTTCATRTSKRAEHAPRASASPGRVGWHRNARAAVRVIDLAGSLPAKSRRTTDERGVPRGLCDQEAPQADGKEEAPQTVTQDTRSATAPGQVASACWVSSSRAREGRCRRSSW